MSESHVFGWRDFLTLAQELAERQGDEAALRTAISRAYYASYCSAADHVLRRTPGLSPFDLGHERVWRTFQDPANLVRWRVFDDGMALRAARLQADYWIPLRGHRLTTQVKDALRLSSRLFDALGNLS
jgi:hypothetical protein